MKNIKYFILLLLIAAGCGERDKKIELLPDYDEIYKTAYDLKITPQIEAGKEFLQSTEFKDLVIKARNNDSVDFPAFLIYKLYINENGTIDKVSNRNKKKIKELDEYLFKKMESIKLKVMEKEGSKIKYSYEWTIELPVKSSDACVILNADEPAIPAGGMASLGQNIKYPEKAKNEGISGKVFIKAYIDENGNVYNTEIIKSVNSDLDIAASEAVRKTKFTPGRLKGKPVKTVVTIPINFLLTN